MRLIVFFLMGEAKMGEGEGKEVVVVVVGVLASVDILVVWERKCTSSLCAAMVQ